MGSFNIIKFIKILLMDRNSQRTERLMEFTGVFGATGIIKVPKSLQLP